MKKTALYFQEVSHIPTVKLLLLIKSNNRTPVTSTGVRLFD
ncbi:hypothetical protein [Paraliobacillus sediminis]|nr:hypothetical protein [Paraliobacillus sediminis]